MDSEQGRDDEGPEKERSSLTDFIRGKSPAMQSVADLIRKVAKLQTTVLIQGETGTGKQVTARYLHEMSHLAHKPLVTLDLSTVPENLGESTLFGHEKGAFTGAHAQRVGKFEMADGGTLFLDEIACLRVDLQSKLLRAIQDGEIERVGSSRTQRVHVRLIVATNANLDAAVRRGEFREDLFYRINVVPVHLPPLRQRSMDLPDLVDHFLAKYNRLFDKEVKKITGTAIEILSRYSWPGNIRELENLMARLIAVSDHAVISGKDIPMEYYSMDPMEGDPSHQPRNLLRQACNTFERNFILKILEREQWNRKRTAKTLGVPLSTLKFKFNKLQIYEFLSGKSPSVLPKNKSKIPDEANSLS